VPASSHLIELLTQWTSQSEEMPNRVIFQKELIEPAALAVNGNRLAMRERRRRDLRQLEDFRRNADTRWEERLDRIEAWRQSVGELQSEHAIIQRLLRSTQWLVKARGKQDTFQHYFTRRADILQVTQQALHEKLAIWEGMLQEKQRVFEELRAKEESANRPLYVSRARKQPEIEFIQEHQSFSEDMGRCIQQLRDSLQRARGRIQKATRIVESQASGSEILYEVNKQEILAMLQNAEKTLQGQREAILSDALTFEGCRHKLKKLHGQIYGLRSLEEYPQPAQKFKITYWKN
jgi:chromosome segregation ATPase